MSAHRNLARLVALPAAVLGFTALAAAPALAHVTIAPGEAEAGSYFVATLAIPHGCEGSPTTRITIKIPEPLVQVTPSRNALWDVTKTTVKLDTPIKAENGDEITDRVDTVVYTAKTPLPDGYRDSFQLNFKVPDEAGSTLAFPVIQKCEQGQTSWTEVTAEGAAEPEHPAPTVKILAAAAPQGAAEAAPTSAPARVEEDGASKGLAYSGLGVGAVGLLVGAVALAKSRARS